MIEDQDDFALERGTGKVFADLGLPDAEREQLRAVLEAEIGKSLMDDNLSVRNAEWLTGCAGTDFCHIRMAKLMGFTIDRPTTILGRLHRKVRVSCLSCRGTWPLRATRRSKQRSARMFYYAVQLPTAFVVTACRR